jgi:hypothetical protein
MGLFHHEPDERKRLKAVSQIQDEEHLVEIASEDPSSEVRRAAARKVMNEKRLAKIAEKAKQIDVVLDAVGRIRDQGLLAEVILTNRNHQVMKAAFEGIADPRILEEIAKDERYSISARRIAIDNFADQSFLEDVAQSVSTPSVKKAASDKLAKARGEVPGKPEEKGLKKATFNVENIEALLQHYGADRILDAVGKFRGSEGAIRSIGLIARQDPGGRAKAIHYLEKALNHSHPNIRLCALEELCSIRPDAEVDRIVSRLENDPDPSVRKAYEELRI